MTIINIPEIKRQIKRIAQSGGRGIALTRHARERMFERDVDINDILYVLNWGEVEHDPDKDADLKFKVSWTDLEGEPLCVVLILLDEESLLIKTVHG